MVVDAVEVGLEAAVEPPGAVVMLRAVVIETRVVVAATPYVYTYFKKVITLD